MNKSFQMGTSASHYLPKIKVNESVDIKKSKPGLYTDRKKADSMQQIPTQIPLTRKLVNMEDIKNINQYETMNEKELLRQHEKLLKIIKKFQQIIDIHLSRKKRQVKPLHNKPLSTKEDLLRSEVVNNKKIIQNYLRQIKDLESAKNQRKLNDVIEERIKVNDEISRLKKDIFNLKNQDVMAGRSLIQDRPQIQKQLKQLEKDLKIELTKKHEYIKKIQELNTHLAGLKKECEGINVNEIMNQKNNNSSILLKMTIKKNQLQQVKHQRQHVEEIIQQNMVAKAKRNKALRREIQNMDKRMTQIGNKILMYKDKINRYQKVMEILPKTAEQNNTSKPAQQGNNTGQKK